MAEVVSNEIPKWVKVALLLAVMLIFLGGCVSLIYPEIKNRFVNDQTKKDEISNNFDVLLRNLEDCSQLTQDNCVCEGFVAWPSFQKETVLEMETRGIVTTFILKYKKEELRTEKLENLKPGAKLITKQQTSGLGAFSIGIENLASDPRIIMDWKTNPPTLLLGGDPGPGFFEGAWQSVFGKKERKVVSSRIYHDQGKMYFLTSFEPADKLSSLIDSMTKCGSNA